MENFENQPIDKLVEACLAPFQIIVHAVFEASDIIDEGNLAIHMLPLTQFKQANGKNIIHNTVYDMEKKYEEELDKLYEQFNVKKGSWYKLPEKEREICRVLYHHIPILNMLDEFIHLAADEGVVYREPKYNPFIIVVAAYTKLYGESFPWWRKQIEKYKEYIK